MAMKSVLFYQYTNQYKCNLIFKLNKYLQLSNMRKLILILITINLVKESLTMPAQNCILNDLLELQANISSKVKKRMSSSLQFYRLFESSLPHTTQNQQLASPTIYPSLPIPYKDSTFHPMILQINHSFLTLRGQQLISSPNAMMSSIRNQMTYFAQDSKKEIKISKLNIVNKKVALHQEFKIEKHQSKAYNGFIAGSTPTSKLFILYNTQNGFMDIFNLHGKLIQNKTFNQQRIISVQKLNTHLFLLTNQSLLSMTLHAHNFSLSHCIYPPNLISLHSDDNNYLHFYGLSADGNLYKYDATNCKCTAVFSGIVHNGQVTIAGEIIFVRRGSLKYYINMTDEHIYPLELPFHKCYGLEKVSITRKSHVSYIISQSCSSHMHHNLSHISLDLDPPAAQLTDFSKFRIPLLIVSFGIIIYVSVKKKSNEKEKGKADPQREKELLMMMMQRQESQKIQESHSNQIKSTHKSPANSKLK